MRSSFQAGHFIIVPALCAAVALVACGDIEQTEVLVARDVVRQDLVGQALVISQFYGGSNAVNSVFTADFVELHNTSGQQVELGGYSLQYGSPSGTGWSNKVNLPDAGIRAGGYFLIRMNNVAGTGAAVPADFAGNVIDMGGTNGKIALVASTTSMPSGACPSSAVIDFVGCGNANCAESLQNGGPAPATSPSSALERKGNGCVDTDSNRADFLLLDGGGATISPRNAASAANVCGAFADGGVAMVPCGNQGVQCLATQCCEDLVFIQNCLEVDAECGNDGDLVCSASSYTCVPADPNADAGVRSVGSPCVNDAQCRADMGDTAACKRATSPSGVAYKNGYCTFLCSESSGCPSGSRCVNPSFYGEETMCWDSCGVGDTCRSGYQCLNKTSNENLGCWIFPTPPAYDAGEGGPVVVDAGPLEPFDAGVPDAGTTPEDAGTTPVDAGTTPVDAGTTPVDAGTTPEVDAGTSPVDAGTTPEVDAGTSPVDAGTETGVDAGTTVDAGQMKVDAGTGKVDAGVKRDAGVGTGPAPTGDTGCGCSTTEVGALAPFALAALALRRRRSSRS